MPNKKNMSVFTTRKDTPYIVDDELAQLLLESHPAPEQDEIVTECARVFETMNIHTVRKDEAE